MNSTTFFRRVEEKMLSLLKSCQAVLEEHIRKLKLQELISINLPLWKVHLKGAGVKAAGIHHGPDIVRV